MKTIAIISQKGGAGKSTLAVHLAVSAFKAGHRTAIIDLDPQATARKWGLKRDAEPEVVSDHATRLPDLLKTAASNGADLVVIDTAPNADQASLGAARAADLILIPCRPAAFDLEAIETTCDLATIARKPAFVVINAAPVRSKIADEARAGLEARGVQCAPVMLSQRAAYSHAVIDGRTAPEFEPGGKAATEVVALYAWACRSVGLSTIPLVRTRRRL